MPVRFMDRLARSATITLEKALTLHIRPEEVGAPLDETTRYTLGMPHLCPIGLSENWLWKELGHRHWNLIARGMGRAAAGFGSESEQPIYAAFRRIALRDGDLGAVGENDALDVRSTLTHLSGTRVESRHIVEHRDRLVADVGMTSIFVRRQTGGVNRSIARVHIEGARRVGSVFDKQVEASVTMPAGRPASESKQDEVEVGTVSVEPCPHLDFNGAGLLYFSSFIAAVDRAEWRLIGKSLSISSVKERRAVFHSNIEVGDDLVVRILAARGEEASEHRSQVFASSDGRLLAEVFTEKGPL